MQAEFGRGVGLVALFGARRRVQARGGVRGTLTDRGYAYGYLVVTGFRTDGTRCALAMTSCGAVRLGGRKGLPLWAEPRIARLCRLRSLGLPFTRNY